MHDSHEFSDQYKNTVFYFCLYKVYIELKKRGI